jgi:hypothetical protein
MDGQHDPKGVGSSPDDPLHLLLLAVVMVVDEDTKASRIEWECHYCCCFVVVVVVEDDERACEALDATTCLSLIEFCFPSTTTTTKRMRRKIATSHSLPVPLRHHRY